MGSPVDFSKDMQRFLLKKEKEYGQLKFISSRATEETSHFVDELLEELTNIVKTYDIYNIRLFYDDDVSNPGETSQAVIKSYNSFLLNTGFSSQHLLAEDILFGYMVNIWPTISPYLFVQIIWRLKWGDLLIESLMYLPLDLCVEILEITIRCLNELEVLQDRRFVFLLISKLYYKCIWLKLGVWTNGDVTEVTHQLVAHFQSLLDLVSTKYAISQSSQEAKYVQHGIFLKNMFRCVKTCMCYKIKNYRETSDDLQSFKITYGNTNDIMDYFCVISTEIEQFVLSTLDKELVTLLQDQIKQVDCFEFMEWAEKDDEENNMISLQRAIIIEIHCFMEFIKQDEFLFDFDSDLLQNLQQFVGLDKSEESTLTVQELCDSIKNNKLDEFGTKELIKRYKEWNQSVLDFIIEEKLLNKKDLGILLEYLYYTYAHSNSHKEKHHTYMLILRVLLGEDLPNMYELVLEYTLRHFYDNPLECLFNSENFIKFIETNIKLFHEQNMRTSVLFVLLNPREVLTTLVRVTMGSTDTKYRNVVFGKLQLPFLHSFLTLKIDNQNTNLLTYILKDAWLHDHSTWCYMEFKTFMNDMFETKTITPDNLLNSVYIPCLATDVFNCSNLLSMLMHMSFVLKEKKCTNELKHVLLIKQLVKKMSLMRKCTPKYSRSIVNDLLYHGRMILNFLFATVALTPNNQIEIMKVNKFVEPIDQVLLAPRLHTMLFGTVKDVIQNYERCCLAKYHQLRTNPECKPKISDFQLDRRALLRHMMLHVTKDEYTNFAIEITIASWAYFGWIDELMAYENVLHITTEAMQLALVFKDTFPKDTFISLLRALIQYCNVLSRLKHQKVDQKIICNILSKTLSFMQSIINETQHGKYDNFFECIDNMYNESDFKVSDYFHNISELFEVHFVQSKEIENETSDKVENGNLSHSASTTSEANDMFKTYQFVCSCIDNTL